MTKQKILYEDVVVGDEIPAQGINPQSGSTKSSAKKPDKAAQQEGKDPKEREKELEKDPNVSEKNAGQESKKEGKDEQVQPSLEARSEKLSEDPFVQESEIKETDTKDKSKQAEEKGSDPKKDLDVLVGRSEKILFHAKGIFPFDFFPNIVTIDANKVNIIIKTFFFTETVTSILLKEIMDVRVESTLFLGKLIIDYGPHPLKINTVYVPSMWKKDALRAKEIIEGNLVLYRSENINTTELKPEETLQEVKEVGKIDDEHRAD